MKGFSLAGLAASLDPAAVISLNDYMLRFVAGGNEVYVFPDGRAIVRGTEDVALALEVYSQYIGS